MIITLDVPNDAAEELDDTLHLMATYAAVRGDMEARRSQPTGSRKWHDVSRALKEAADSILIPT